MIQSADSNTTQAPIQIRKRDGRIVDFETARIQSAIAAAFRAVQDLGKGIELDDHSMEQVNRVAYGVLEEVKFDADRAADGVVDVERVQDHVETQLMQHGEFSIARRYIVYREERNRARALRGENEKGEIEIRVKLPDGTSVPMDTHLMKRRVYEACYGLDQCKADDVLQDLYASLYDGIAIEELERALIMVARQRIEREPAYNQVATRLVLNIIYKEALGQATNFEHLESLPLFDSTNDRRSAATTEFEASYRSMFSQGLTDGVQADILDRELLTFDLKRLADAIEPMRDFDFQYLGVQTIYDRYLIHVDGRRIETPQFFWMRVAMGLSIKEDDREARAIEFYSMLSTFRLISATPTLFNSGTKHPQLSSCYLTTVDDDLAHIFKCVGDNAMLSKWAGGLGNDWTRVRATGAHIKGTNGKSQGVIPFLKIVNDAAIAVNQGGKRKGAVCSYLESWHLDVEEFLELRKNTGDDRRRTHDMHTANWIPDLFMKRVQENGTWTLFSPDEVPELHDLYGRAFEAKYTEYERKAHAGELRQHKQINAVDLWRKMLSMVFETGHPWLTFKDPSNVRSPQDHAGVVHNSNLCTEILLNTSNDETAVCNLCQINLKRHAIDGKIDRELLAGTVHTAMRMLDNVIDINYYPTPEAKNANMRHRPVGLGMMGFQDCLYELRLPYASEGAVQFADQITEFISYHAILASTELAEQRGTYESYKGSKWDRGMLPIDTVKLMIEERGGDCTQDTSSSMDWQPVRDALGRHGMRNSNVMAIAPTATTSNILGSTQSIEPTFRNLYVKSNLSGDFTVINEALVKDLKRLDLWDDRMLDDLKYYDGALTEIDRIPEDIRKLYETAFEIDVFYLIEATSRRQKWIDMGISFNLYIDKPSGRMLNDMYMECWLKGLKTTYYLRSVAATQIEKSSMDVNKRGAQPRWMKNKSASAVVIKDQEAAPAEAPAAPADVPEPVITKDLDVPRPDAKATIDAALEGIAMPEAPKACSIDNPDCEACQ